MKRLLHAGLAILLLSACSPQATALPIHRVAVSPAAQPVSEAVAACVPIDDASNVTIETRYPVTADLDEFDLLIRLGEPDPDAGFAAQLAWEEIILIVNRNNNVDLTRDEAISLFSGRTANWSELGGEDVAVSFWAGPQSDEARTDFESQILLSLISGNTRIAANPRAALNAVASDLGAVAILPAAWADETVEQIDLGLQVPVIAVAADEPTGVIRELLGCLQGPTGQDALSNSYSPFQ